MLVLRDEEVRQLLTLTECIDAVAIAFRQYGAGVAKNLPRCRYEAEGLPDRAYFANVHVGAVPALGVAAVRIGSNLHAKGRRADRPGATARVESVQDDRRNWGTVLLYSLTTSELLAMLPDFWLSGVRVGATTALAARYLARAGARSVGLFGSGKQARANLAGLCAVRPISQVKVFSPSAEHRQAFAAEMSATLGIDVAPVATARAAVQGADIVCCATNSAEPVLDAAWLEPGQLVVSIGNSDAVNLRQEVDAATLDRCDAIWINDRASIEVNRQSELLAPLAAGKVRQISELLLETHPGRQRPEELIYYKNNTGMAIQFAAAGAVIYRKARERGLGQDLPGEWFSTDLSEYYAAGFHPSS